MNKLILCLALCLLPFAAWAEAPSTNETPATTPTATTSDTTPATTETDTTPAPPGTSASLNPDISVIGTLKGSIANGSYDADTNRHLQLDELEMVIAGKLYPGISALAVLTAGDKRPVGIEEAYLSDEQLVPSAPIGARLGVVRLPFGKANPQHPHTLPYIDTASVLNNLLGEFRGNGFEAIAIIPTHSKVFLQAQLGRWKSVGDEPSTGFEGPGFQSFGDRAMTLARLWSSIPVGESNEFELGGSDAIGDPESGSKLTLEGVDATWRHYLPGERRIMVQGEAIQRNDAGVTSSGYYLLGTYRIGPDYEFGSRYDWSEFAADNTHHESYISVFGTHALTEATFLRLQVKHGADRDNRTVNEVLGEIVFGFGPHTHPLQ